MGKKKKKVFFIVRVNIIFWFKSELLNNSDMFSSVVAKVNFSINILLTCYFCYVNNICIRYY